MHIVSWRTLGSRVTTVMSNWNVNPAVTNDQFVFVPPRGAQAIRFLPLLTTSGSNQ